ncbi:BatA domain-containing protein [Salinimicrobium sp. GXAS 041]|uniref:BatA domain-containing protein n=1 Tax=Salinimicrobium sp. GXAS 041 TaxID=3400806 RepID=UPI003C77F769
MHFQHPELLYALFLLLIPILVHLFQLRKFRKEDFTNVKFLRKVNEEKRKSSRIKKWLILCSRLLLLAAVILAFAQPYLPSRSGNLGEEQETVIYLDNSYSMQAKGANGILLKRSIQDLLENLPQERPFSLFTNDLEWKNITLRAVQNDLQQIDYSAQSLRWKDVILKANDLSSKNRNASVNFIAISDFRKTRERDYFSLPAEFNTRLVQVHAQNKRNISVDTAWISARTIDETILNTTISALHTSSEEILVSLYNGERLIAKKTAVLGDSIAEIEFTIPTGEFARGRIKIDDPGLPFDNQLFFNINENEPVNVVIIGEQEDSFLKRIYQTPEFNVSSFSGSRVDYDMLTSANLVVLNELPKISSPLAGTLRSLLQEGIYLVIIPSEEAEIDNYNAFFKENGLPEFRGKIEQENLISEISFEHRLFQTVFNEEVYNFEYPKVQQSYRINGYHRPVLSYENGQPFLFQRNNSYIFTAPINLDNSNFQMSPLIVPTLFNVGNLALKSTQLYYILGNQATVDVSVATGRDEILKVGSEDYVFIPRQQNYQNKVELQLNEAPEQPGTYSIFKGEENLQAISFNINRRENNLVHYDLTTSQNNVHSSVSEVFREIELENEIDALWKWFIIFGLLMLLTEMLILKFYK